MPGNFLTGKYAGFELGQKSVILVKVVWSVIGIIVITFGVNMVLQPERVVRYGVIISLLLLASAITLALVKKGKVYLSSLLYTSFLLVMVFVFSWTGGGVKGHGIRILPIVVLLAGLLLGKKEIWIFGIISIVGGLGFVFAEQFHYLPVGEAIGQSPLIYWIYGTTGILLLCLLANVSVEVLREALHDSRRELALREKSESMLTSQNKQLVEIAFLQSHMVRRPVANVLGLISLIKLDDPADPVNMEIIPKLGIAAEELNAVIENIVRNTNRASLLGQGNGGHAE